MNLFSLPRFQRLFLNDLQTQGRKILMASAGATIFGLLTYLMFMTGVSGDAPRLYQWLFSLGLLIGGFVTTSMIFSDMHHPVERFFYLTQPVSNFERLLSRYLISGPLFYVYFVAIYFLFEVIAKYLSLFITDQAAHFFEFNDPIVQGVSHAYLASHVVVLLGAIYFRSYCLIKTSVALAGFCVACIAVFWVSMRIIFWDYFPSLFAIAPVDEPPTSFNPAAWPGYIHTMIQLALYLWVLFIAYTSLQDHEA
ncbi:MAG: hypothetical protein V4628_07070 [Pseudomonadota bacterium]